MAFTLVEVVREGPQQLLTPPISNPSEVVGHLQDILGNRDRENFAVLHLDARNQVRSYEIASIGSPTASLVHPATVFRAAILAGAVNVIFVHNHPSGNPTPSREDRQITERLQKAGELLGIHVLDHLVVTSDTYASLTDSAVFQIAKS